jgi:hypothetical protein
VRHLLSGRAIQTQCCPLERRGHSDTRCWWRYD